MKSVPPPQLRLGRNAFTGVVLVIFAAALVALWWVAQGFYIGLATRDAEQRADFYRSTVVSALTQFDHLPVVLAEDPILARAFVSEPMRDGANTRLARFANAADLDAIYLMDQSGLTVSASNFDEVPSFLGQNYAFRPYFRDALNGGTGAFFAIGATTSLPGYFRAEPVRDRTGSIIGVVALKRDLAPLTQTWQAAGERVFVSNAAGVIVLASNPEWRYNTLHPLTPDARRALENARQFGTEPLRALPDFDPLKDRVRLDGRDMLHVKRAVGQLGWHLHYFAPVAEAESKARLILVIAGFALTGLLALALFARSRRIRAALVNSQDARRLLQRTNANLAREITERRTAERELSRAQTELERTSRLAALGQLSASVTHELGQPIAAMQTYLGMADLPGSTMDADSRDVMHRLTAILRRMEGIVKQLRHFAHPQPPDLQTADLRDVVRGALDLLHPRPDAPITVALPDSPILVRMDALRMEQVLVNLLRNARDASLHNDTPTPIELRITTTAHEAKLSVRDYGQGLAEPDRVFDPFYTTKASGAGMGLGLAISSAIMREHGGSLSAHSPDGPGAEFVLVLPRSDDDPCL